MVFSRSTIFKREGVSIKIIGFHMIRQTLISTGKKKREQKN